MFLIAQACSTKTKLDVNNPDNQKVKTDIGSSATSGNKSISIHDNKTKTATNLTKLNKKQLKMFNRDFVGEWFVFNSSSQFVISLNQNILKIYGKDVYDNETIKLTNLGYRDHKIKGVMITASTNHKIKFSLKIVDSDTLECQIINGETQKLIWQRKTTLMK